MAQNKFNYTAKVVNNQGVELTLNYNNGHVLVVNTGRTFPCTLKIFRGIVKENNGTLTKSPNLKLGQYINVKTGKVESLYGC